MKKMSRLLALVMALVLAFGTFTTAMAEDSTGFSTEGLTKGLLEDLTNAMLNGDYCYCGHWFYGAQKGDLNHEEWCPWHFAKRTLSEQYDVLASVADEDKDTYKAYLNEETLDKLARVNALTYNTNAANGTNVNINVPDDAFSSDYLLTVKEVGITEEIINATSSSSEDYNESSVVAFDISFPDLETENHELQPQNESSVELTFTIPTSALSYTANSSLFVYHLSENGDGSYVSERVGQEVLINPEADEQTIVLSATSFSTYYVKTGTASTSILSNGQSHTIYITPGSSVQFSVQNGRNTASITWSPTALNYSTSTSGSNNNRITTWTVSNITESAVGNSYQATLSWGSNYNRSTATVTIVVMTAEDMEEQAGNIEKQTVLDKFDNRSYPVYIAVRRNGQLPNEPSIQASASYYFINNSYTTGNNVSFANYAEGIVSEDIVDHELFFFTPYYAGEEVVGLVNSTGEVIKEMVNGVNWDYDSNGNLMTNSVLYAAARAGGATATDGNTVNTTNVNNYKLVPYVVKLQENNGTGWHIDCAIVPKAYVQLSYVFNLPTGVTIDAGQTLGLPNQQTGLPNPTADFTIDSISGLKTITASDGAVYQNAMNVTYDSEGYVFYFMGWNTEPDGTGEWYFPNGWTYSNLTDEQKKLVDEDAFKTVISIKEDTVLYAIWNSNPAIGTGNLLIRKVLSDESGEVSSNNEYTFTVQINNATESATYRYITYAANGVAVTGGAGNVTNGGVVKLLAGQYVIINDLPAVNDENGAANVTVTETGIADEFVVQWNNQNEVGTTTAVKIEGGRRSEITCTNTKEASKGSLTIEKEVKNETGFTPAVNSFVFTVAFGDGNTYSYQKYNADKTTYGAVTESNTFTLTDGQYVTYTDIPADVTYTVTEAAVTGYTTTKTGDAGTIAAGTESTAKFVNEYKTGSLTITKDVVGDDAPETDTFAFNVSVKNTDGTAWTGDYAYSVNGAAEVECSGTALISNIADDSTIIVTGLPLGATYEVAEVANDKYTTTVDGTESLTTSGTVAATNEPIDYVNTYKTASLTVAKTGIQSIDHHETNGTHDEERQSTLFRVKGVSGTATAGIDLTIAICGNDSETIKGLPVGNYTVEEITSWSWRYTPDQVTKSVEVKVAGDNTVTFTNSRPNDKWLSGDCYEENVFPAPASGN